MLRSIIRTTLILTLAAATPGFAQEKKEGAPAQPPANVVVADAAAGDIAPTAKFVGSVYYIEVSDIASKSSGSVTDVYVEEGDRVDANAPLVFIDTATLEKQYRSAEAGYKQALARLERAKKEFARTSRLFDQKSVSEQAFDNAKYNLLELEAGVAAAEAEFQRLGTEMKNHRVTTPFAGVVITRDVDRGEWLSPGARVAVVARDSEVEAQVFVPEQAVAYQNTGRTVRVTAGDRSYDGVIAAVVPRADIGTRTFPVKVRVTNDGTLYEGMQARVELPVGADQGTIIVPRDAVIDQYGRNVVVVAADGTAKVVGVKVIGYDGLSAGVVAEGLKPGDKVVVKGQERLRDGQPIAIISGGSDAAAK